MATVKSMRYVAVGVLFLGSLPQICAQETLGGLGAAGGMAAGLGASAATGIRPRDVTRNVPPFPGGDMSEGGAGGNAGPGAPGAGAPGTTTTTTTTVTTRAVRFNSISGQTFLNELLSARTTRPTEARPLRSPRGQAAYARRMSRATPRQRSRAVLSKYRVPPVGWRSYYLAADRYKFGKMWQFVTIEDDPGAYPVKYYYRPNSASMLRLLSRRPAKSQLRANRVIGFYSWQDAMLAGYRPDPISRPEPAGDVVYLAGLSRSPQLGRYIEYLYAGAVRPAVHNYNMSYVRNVASVVNSRTDTRPLMTQTVSQVLGAILGENALPTAVGGGDSSSGSNLAIRGKITDMATGESQTFVTPLNPTVPASTNSREEDFNKFGNRAGKLANTPGNR